MRILHWILLTVFLATTQAEEVRYLRIAVTAEAQVAALHQAGYELADVKVRQQSIGGAKRFKWFPENGFVTVIIGSDTEKAAVLDAGFTILREGIHFRAERPRPMEDVPPFQFGWPRSIAGAPGVYGQAATVHDFNRNGEKSIFLSNTEGYAYMWRPNGAFVLGFPRAPDPANFWSTGSRETAAAGDLDGDHVDEVVFGRWVGLLYAYQYQLGEQLPGFPINFGLQVSTNDPVMYDFDDDGRDEMVIYTFPEQTYASGSIHIINENGTNLPGWPVSVVQYSESSPAIGDIDDDGEMEIVFGSGDVPNGGIPGELHAYNVDGTIVPGFPVEVGYGVDTPPTIYDIDMNGVDDILIRIKLARTDINGIYAYDGNGSLLPGFPAEITRGGSAHGAPAIADVNGDGLPEIAYGTALAVDSGQVWLFNNSGDLMPGFPQLVYATWVEESVSLEDVSGDTLPDIVCGTNGVSNDPARLYAFDYEGNVISGYPYYNNELLSSLESTPAIYDIDDDGDTEIITASHGGTVFVFDTPGIPAATRWPTYKYNAARMGSIPKNITGLSGEVDETLPGGFRLAQNYPNPFNPTTNIEFEMSEAGFVELRVYDITGRIARTLVSESRAAGSYVVPWDGRDDDGRLVASGIYLYQLQVNGKTTFNAAKKMMLMK